MTVIMQEHVKAKGDSVTIGGGHRLNQNLRRAGEDLKTGQVALKRGVLLRPAEIGLVASLGIGEISVYRKLRVAFFSTGDELRSIGTPLGAGQIYDSNRYTIHEVFSVASPNLRTLRSAIAWMAAIVCTSGTLPNRWAKRRCGFRYSSTGTRRRS